MSLWKQLRTALRCQIEDFLRVKWQAVALLLLIIAGIIDMAWLRITYGVSWWHDAPFWSVHVLLVVGTLLALRQLRRFLP